MHPRLSCVISSHSLLLGKFQEADSVTRGWKDIYSIGILRIPRLACDSYILRCIWIINNGMSNLRLQRDAAKRRAPEACRYVSEGVLWAGELGCVAETHNCINHAVRIGSWDRP